MLNIAEILDSVGPDVFFHFDEAHIDWTSEKKASLIIQSNGKKSCIELVDPKVIEEMAASIPYYFKDCNLYSWNLKNLISFFKKKTSLNLKFENDIYDLYILCSYFSLGLKKPKRTQDAALIVNHLKQTDIWDKFLIFYKKIYTPLIQRVIPDIETDPLVNLKTKSFSNCYYELEGQANGRMKTLKLSNNSYMPHSMSDDDKNNIALPDPDDVFLVFDYKHMEVSVLEWLSKDKGLSEILSEDRDLYSAVWEYLTKTDADESQRSLCKKILLPVVFGLGPKSLSKKLGLSEKNASKLIYKLVDTFPVAFSWVESQRVDSNNFATDFFGRRRKFSENEFYKIRNFCVQSPSNMICLKKLVDLHDSLIDAKLRFHVHDGYVISCNKREIKNVYKNAKLVLEKDDEMFLNLKLKVSCKYGKKLNNLFNINEVI